MNDAERISYANKFSALVYGTSGFAYKMDFVNMVQVNEKTERWRGVKRDNIDATLRVSIISEEFVPIPWIEHPAHDLVDL